MAVTMIKIDKDTSYAEFICDTVNDLSTGFPHRENLAGCVAYVLENKSIYIMDSQGQWEEQ